MTYAQSLADARDLKAVMARWGVRCSIELQGGRGGDPWATPTKYLRMHHHTVSTYRPGGNMTPVLSLVKTGRPDVVGPLCNGYGGYDLVYRIITMGLANHPGAGGPIVIDGVRVPQDSARGPTWGTEWEGGIQTWETIPGMLEFMGRADCALAEWSGRPLTSQLEHKTWAPDRKVDRKDFTRSRGIALSRTWAAHGGDTHMSAEDVEELKEHIDTKLEEHDYPGNVTRVADLGFKQGWPVYHTDFLTEIHQVNHGGALDNFIRATKKISSESADLIQLDPTAIDELFRVTGKGVRNTDHLH